MNESAAEANDDGSAGGEEGDIFEGNSNLNHSAPSMLFQQQPSWIANLIDQDPTTITMPSLFPYHIPTGFSVGPPSTRRLSGSTIATNINTDSSASNNPQKRKGLEESMDKLKITTFLHRLHQSHLKRPRPTFRANPRKQAVKLLVEAQYLEPKIEELWSIYRYLKGGSKSTQLARLFSWLRQLDLGSNDTQKACYELQQSRLERNSVSRHDLEIDAYILLLWGKVQLDINQPDTAATIFQKAKDTWLKLQICYDDAAYDVGMAETMFLLGKAQLASNEALSRAELQHTLANTDRERTALEQALSNFTCALDAFKTHDAHDRLYDTMKSIGNVYCLQNQYHRAQEHFDDCLTFLREHLRGDNKEFLVRNGHVLVAETLLELGDNYCLRNEQAQAKVFYKDCLSISQQNLEESDELVAEAKIALGDLYSFNGRQPDLALEYFQDVLDSAILANHIALKTSLLLFQQGNTSSALAEFQYLIRLCQDAKSVEDDVYFDCVLSSGVCYYAEGNKEEAKTWFKEAIRLASETALFAGNSQEVTQILKTSEAQLDTKTRFGKAFDSINRRMQGMPHLQGLAVDYWAMTNIPEVATTEYCVTWYYYLHDDPFLKPDGWYVFDYFAGKKVEANYQTYMATGDCSRFEVTGAWGDFAYEIDLEEMAQRNIGTNTKRPIQRSKSGEVPR